MSQNLEFPTKNHPSHLNSARKHNGNSSPGHLKKKLHHPKQPMVYEEVHGFDTIKEEEGFINSSPNDKQKRNMNSNHQLSRL